MLWLKFVWLTNCQKLLLEKQFSLAKCIFLVTCSYLVNYTGKSTVAIVLYCGLHKF